MSLESSNHDISLFRYLENHANDGIWIWHIQDDYEYLSPRFKSILGYSDDEMANHPSSWQKFVFPEDLKIMWDNVSNHFSGGPPLNIITRYYHKDGSTVYIQCNGAIVERFPDGKPKIMIGTHMDVTKLKLTEQNLEKERERLIKQMNKKTEFVAELNHELRNPLNVILGYCQILNYNKVDPKIDQIYKAGMHMLNVVNDFCDISKLELSLDLDFFICDETFFNQIITTHSVLSTEYDIIFVKPVVSRCKVYGDQNRFRQLISNIFSNAIKYSFPKGIVTTHFSCDQTTNDAVLKITDEGCGIPENLLTNIFSPFNNTSSNSDLPKVIKQKLSVLKSSGLGLAVSKRIADMMNYNIQISSTLNKGTTVSIIIPKDLCNFNC